MKNILFIFLLLIIILPKTARAEYFELRSQIDSIFGVGDEFYIDLVVDPKDISINGIEGKIEVSEGLKVIGIENGQSIVKNWIETPVVTNSFVFSGIIPNGFSGYLNSDQKEKGLVFRVLLKAESVGKKSVFVKDLSITKNDGIGTLLKVPSVEKLLNVKEVGAGLRYRSEDFVKPTIYYEIVSNQDIFEGKYFLVFNAQDDRSGIKEVSIKERGHKDFKKIESPYLLEDQSRKGIITLRAIDNSNNETIVKIKPEVGFINILFYLVSFALFVSIIFYAKYKFKKNINNI